jgi:hypothetical protein
MCSTLRRRQGFSSLYPPENMHRECGEASRKFRSGKNVSRSSTAREFLVKRESSNGIMHMLMFIGRPGEEDSVFNNRLPWRRRTSILPVRLLRLNECA